MKKLSVMLFLAVSLSLLPVGLVHADSIVFANPNWYEFLFGAAGTDAIMGREPSRVPPAIPCMRPTRPGLLPPPPGSG